MQRKKPNTEKNKQRAAELSKALAAAAPPREGRKKKDGRAVAYSAPQVNLSELDLSPFKARAEELGLTEVQARFFALYMDDRLAGRNTSRPVLYLRLTGASIESSRTSSQDCWRAIVSRGLIPDILEAAGVTVDLALSSFKEALSGREIVSRVADDGSRDYEVTINPKARLEASMKALEMLGLYTAKVEVGLSTKSFAELMKEATLEARKLQGENAERVEFEEVSETGRGTAENAGP